MRSISKVLQSHASRTPILRSLLVLKASAIERWDNYYKVPADASLLDLEDAVLPENKDWMRTKLAHVIPQIPIHANPWVRINCLSEGPNGVKDIESTLHPNLVGYILPKICHENEIFDIQTLLEDLERQRNCEPGIIKLMPVIETLECVGRLTEIAAASPRISHFVLGSYDLQAEMFTGDAHGETNQLVAHQALIIAKAFGINILQGPLIALDNHNLFDSTSTEAYEQGYTGRVCLTPAQVIIANNCFQPSHRDYAEADIILANKQNGIGTMKTFEKKNRLMTGPPMVAWATKVHNLKNSVYERDTLVRKHAEEKLGWKSPKCTVASAAYYMDSAFEDTIQEFHLSDSLRAIWNASVINPHRIFNIATFDKNVSSKAGFNDLQVPYSLMLFLATLVDDRAILKRNGIAKWIYVKNAIQFKPAYFGSTVFALSEITKFPTASDKVTAISRKLFYKKSKSSKRAELLFQMTCEVDGCEFEENNSTEISKQQPAELSNSDPGDDLRLEIIQNFRLHDYFNIPENCNKKLVKNETYVHRFVYVLNSFDFEPIRNCFATPSDGYHNRSRLNSKDGGAIDGLVLAKSLSNVFLDFGHILWTKIDISLSLSQICEGSSLVSVSYIKNVQIPANNNDVEEVELITLGLRDIDPAFVMSISIPLEILEGINEPKRYDEITAVHCRELFQKIVTVTEWRFLRLADNRNDRVLYNFKT